METANCHSAIFLTTVRGMLFPAKSLICINFFQKTVMVVSIHVGKPDQGHKNCIVRRPEAENYHSINLYRILEIRDAELKSVEE